MRSRTFFILHVEHGWKNSIESEKMYDEYIAKLKPEQIFSILQSVTDKYLIITVITKNE